MKKPRSAADPLETFDSKFGEAMNKARFAMTAAEAIVRTKTREAAAGIRDAERAIRRFRRFFRA